LSNSGDSIDFSPAGQRPMASPVRAPCGTRGLSGYVFLPWMTTLSSFPARTLRTRSRIWNLAPVRARGLLWGFRPLPASVTREPPPSGRPYISSRTSIWQKNYFFVIFHPRGSV